MKIAVVGSNGQLGSELCRQLSETAVGLDLPRFDITCRDDVVERLSELQPQVIINTAAYTQVDKAEELPSLCRSVNVDGVSNLVLAASILNCTFVQISSDYVFDRDVGQRTPFKETDAANPRGVYASTKLEGEKLTGDLEKHFIVRTCGLYGRNTSAHGKNFVDTMLKLATQDIPIRVVGDQYCTPSYVPHIARAIRFLIETDAYGTYHVVNSGETTWHDFAAEIFRQADIPARLVRITTAEYAALPPRPKYSVLDTSKYCSLPNAPALPSWQEGIAEYLKLRME